IRSNTQSGKVVSSHSSAWGWSSLIAKRRIDSRSCSCSSVKMKCLRWEAKSGLRTSAVVMASDGTRVRGLWGVGEVGAAALAHADGEPAARVDVEHAAVLLLLGDEEEGGVGAAARVGVEDRGRGLAAAGRGLAVAELQLPGHDPARDVVGDGEADMQRVSAGRGRGGQAENRRRSPADGHPGKGGDERELAGLDGED